MTQTMLPPLHILSETAAELATTAQAAGDVRNTNALNKAMFYLHNGVTPTATTGGYLLTSGTRAGTIHRVSTSHGCSCEAGQVGRPCWHASLVEIVSVAQERMVPMDTLAVRYANACAEIDELFA